MPEANTQPRVLLVNLRSAEYPTTSLPLALPTIGGTLKQVFGLSCIISYFDRQLSGWTELQGILRTNIPDLVGISAQFGTVTELAECLRVLHAECPPSTPCVVGNVVGTYAADRLAAAHPDLLCCVGRGEELLVRLVEGVRSGTGGPDLAAMPNLVHADASGRLLRTEMRAIPPSFVAPVDWDGYAAHYDLHDYDEIWVEGSRGCPQKRNDVGCTYCAILPDAGSRDWRPRPLDLVLTDLETLARRDVRHVRFADEEFMANQPDRMLEFTEAVARLRDELAPDHILPTFDVAMRVDDVVRPNPAQDRPRLYMAGERSFVIAPNALRELALRRLMAVGLRQVYLGVESGSRAQLRRMRKGVTPEGNQLALDLLQRLGLQAACGWIMFDPFLPSSADLVENIEFIERNRLIPESLQDSFVTSPANTMRVLVGTPLKEQVERAGLLGGLAPNLLEHEFTYLNPDIGRLVAALDEWRAGYQQSIMYGLKNRVAHAALDPEARDSHPEDQHMFFALKRLDFDVCRWLVEDLGKAELTGTTTHRFTLPASFQHSRAKLFARMDFAARTHPLAAAAGTSALTAR